MFTGLADVAGAEAWPHPRCTCVPGGAVVTVLIVVGGAVELGGAEEGGTETGGVEVDG
jgi:hypothetical protein